MLKPITAIVAAAAILAAITLLLAPSAMVAAGPLPSANAAPMQACAQRPWPYLRCVGTPFGNPHVRLISVDRLSSDR
jgi:hypothetical protein